MIMPAPRPPDMPDDVQGLPCLQCLRQPMDPPRDDGLCKHCGDAKDEYLEAGGEHMTPEDIIGQ